MSMTGKPESGLPGPGPLVGKKFPIKAAKQAPARPAVVAIAAITPVLSEDMGSLDLNHRKARYGVSYLRAVCSQAGMPVSETAPDEDVLAVDCDVKFEQASVLVQVKCTSRLTVAGRSASVRLEPEWRAKWAKQKVPVYLLLVIVPKKPSEWLSHLDDKTMHATAAYWVRVNGSEGDSVNVPKSQRLTASTFETWHGQLLACFQDTA